ncbi:MAG: hypothetical protein ACM3PE_04665 [Deltaproteobacteria bacterium]
MLIKRISSFIMILMILAGAVITPDQPVFAASKSEKKVLILINDYIGVDDIAKNNIPNLQALAKQSGIGLINNRVKNKVPASAYMSLGTANRVATVDGSEMSFDSSEAVPSLDEIYENPSSPLNAGILYRQFTGKTAPTAGVVNLYIEPATKYALTHNPLYVPGGLGYWARTQNFETGVLGNSDTIYSLDRSAAILAMDEKGIVPRGLVSNGILKPDPNSPGGLRSDHTRLLKELEKMLAGCDIVVMDLGDTSRVELSRVNCADSVVARQRAQALKRNDQLLGKILKQIDLNKTMIIMVTPNANADMVFAGNFTLTPIIVYNPEAGPGYLSSPTTRRSGLVTNVDLLPTVISYMTPGNNTGAMTTVAAQNGSFADLTAKVKLYQDIRNSRNPFHYVFMLMALLMLLIAFLAYLQSNKKLASYLTIIVFTVLSTPLVFLFLGYTRYQYLPLILILVPVAAWLVAKIVLLVTDSSETGLLLLTCLTGISLLVDCFRGSPWMLVSPLGSDTIAGGRFYGIGNDYMGVLVATSVIATMLLLNRIKLRQPVKVLLGMLPLLISAFAIGAPEVGANVGGLITALVALGMFIVTITQTRVTFKRLAVIGLLAVMAVLIVAKLDATFSANPSHAGKAISSLFSGGYQVFLSIIITKLGILGSTVIHSSWTIILILDLLLLLVFKLKMPDVFRLLNDNSPPLAQSNRILAISTMALFVFNDTGVIASAIILLYITGCLLISAQDSPFPEQGR